ncbi:hypothetical protein MRX96_047296 [Rhipicephalus microplus]
MSKLCLRLDRPPSKQSYYDFDEDEDSAPDGVIMMGFSSMIQWRPLQRFMVEVKLRGPAVNRLRKESSSSTPISPPRVRRIGKLLSTRRRQAPKIKATTTKSAILAPLYASAITPGPPHRVVKHLGVTIDHRLSWRPAVNDPRTSNRKVLGAACSLLARGHGCTPAFAL